MLKAIHKSSQLYYTSKRSMGVIGRLLGKEPPLQKPHVALNMSKQELIARQSENDVSWFLFHKNFILNVFYNHRTRLKPI